MKSISAPKLTPDTMSRPAAPSLPTQAIATRYLRAARAAGVVVREMRVDPDGALRIIFADGGAQNVAPASPLDAWGAERDG